MLADGPGEPSGNLIRNGGFEMMGPENAPEGWLMQAWQGESLVSGRVEDRGRFGRRLLHLTSQDAMALHGCYTQPIEISQYAGGQTLLSMYYRADETTFGDAIVTTYAEDFALKEFDTPILSREEITLAPNKRWTGVFRKLDVPLGARHLLVMLRAHGRGEFFIDGVALRGLPAEVACDLVGAGLVAGPAKRVSILNLRNTSGGQIGGRLQMDVVEADRTDRRADQEFTLSAGEEQQVRLEYSVDADKPHRVLLTLLGSQEDDVYAYEDLSVPGLIDAHVTVPAFRSMLLDGIPTDYVQVKGRLHAVPELAGKLDLSARLAAAERAPTEGRPYGGNHRRP